MNREIHAIAKGVLLCFYQLTVLTAAVPVVAQTTLDFSAIIEPKRDTALIGAIVLEELDLVADCVTQTVHPRDPRGIVSEIE